MTPFGWAFFGFALGVLITLFVVLMLSQVDDPEWDVNGDDEW